MNKSRTGAKIGRGHAEMAPTPSGGVQRIEEVVSYDIPHESAFLMTVDSLQDPELKKLMIDSYKDIHEHRKAVENRIIERNENRQDRALEANIRINLFIQIGGFISFITVFIGFMVAVLAGCPYQVLWPFSIFFFGSAGIYLLRKFGDKDNSPPSNK